jgi:hypothetical protein
VLNDSPFTGALFLPDAFANAIGLMQNRIYTIQAKQAFVFCGGQICKTVSNSKQKCSSSPALFFPV